MTKIGQSPPMEIKGPKRLEEALGEHAQLSRKALTSRHQGYGIGAVAYLRRIIEETTDTLLDLVRDVLELEAGREAEIAHLDEAKKSRVFEDKVRLAGDVLPAHVRPGGINPFATLHDVLSAGVHRLSEEKALLVATAAIDSLEYLFTELDTHVRDKKAYVERIRGVQKLQQEMSE